MVRFEPVETLNPAPRLDKLGVAALCPCRSVSILIFSRGEFKKGMGGRRQGALPFEKRKRAEFKYNKEQTAQIHQMSHLHKIRNIKWSLAIQIFLRNGEAQICMRLAHPPRPRAILPAIFEEH